MFGIRKGGIMARGRLISFVVGGVVGAGVALLFAPRSGTETRAMITDRAEDLWGEGSERVSQGYEQIKTEAANVQSQAAKANDELRVKIENARSVIAEQVAKNAQSARDAINAQVPVTGEKIDQAADVVKGQIDNAATKLKTAAADFASKDADAADAIASTAHAATGTVSASVQNVADTAASAAKEVGQTVADAAKEVGSEVKDAASEVGNTVKDATTPAE